MKKLSLFAVLLLALCLLMSCTQAPAETPDTPDTSAETADPNAKITYTVTVLDQNGTPVAGVAVQMCTETSCLMPSPTGADGTATFTLAPDSYHVTIAACPEGYSAVAGQEFNFAEGATSLTVEITKD